MSNIACPKCGGECWDNRASKRKPTQPDFRCKDRNCDGVIWPPRNAAPVASNGNGNGNHAPAPTTTAKRPLGPLYNECLDFANKACIHYFGKDVAAADVVAAAATLFIQAVKDGGTIRAVAPTPAPAAPPPAPADNGYAQSTSTALPF